MDSWNSDLVLNVVQFLSVKDSSRLAQTASRYYYLVHHYRRLRGPDLVSATSRSPDVKTRQKTPKEVTEEALSQLQSPPNLALCFGTMMDSLSMKLPQLLPNNAVILEAISGSVQSSLKGHLESKSHASVMLSRLHNATIHPFCLEGEMLEMNDQGMNNPFDSFVQELEHQHQTSDWTFFLVYACGEGSESVEAFVHRLQTEYPDATIVGGICSSGSVSVPPAPPHLSQTWEQMRSIDLMQLLRSLGGGPDNFSPSGKKELVDRIRNLVQSKTYFLNQVEDGIFGVALAGNVPVRSVVSRGVKSLSQHGGVPGPTTPFYVTNAEIHQPGDQRYMFRGDDSPPYHMVRQIKDQETGKTYTPLQMLTSFGQPDLVGLRRPGEDGFELHMPHPLSFNLNALLFVIHTQAMGRSLENANIDLFDLDGEACMRDMEAKMSLLKEQTRGEQILGGIMISCGARGPMAGSLIPESMADAKRFANVFGDNVPCLGFYAGGEIGPLALAGRESVFQTGNATLQGFTCVFALFIVPHVDLGSIHLDDSRENVRAFLNQQLHG